MADGFVRELLASAGGYVGGVECAKVMVRDAHNMEVATNCRRFVRELDDGGDPRVEVITEALEANYRTCRSGGSTLLHIALQGVLAADDTRAQNEYGIAPRALWAAIDAVFTRAATRLERVVGACPAGLQLHAAARGAAGGTDGHIDTRAADLGACGVAVWPTADAAMRRASSAEAEAHAYADPRPPAAAVACALAHRVVRAGDVQCVVRDAVVPLPRGCPALVALHCGEGSVVVVPRRAAGTPLAVLPPVVPLGDDLQALFVLRFELSTTTTQGKSILTERRLDAPPDDGSDAVDSPQSRFQRIVTDLGVRCVVAAHIDPAAETWLWDTAAAMGVHVVAETPVEEMQRLARLLRAAPLASTLAWFKPRSDLAACAAASLPHVVQVRLSSVVPNDPLCVSIRVPPHAQTAASDGVGSEAVYIAASRPGMQTRIAHHFRKALHNRRALQVRDGDHPLVLPAGGLYEVAVLAALEETVAEPHTNRPSRSARLMAAATAVVRTAIEGYLRLALTNAGVHACDAHAMVAASTRVVRGWLAGGVGDALPAPVLAVQSPAAAAGWLCAADVHAWEPVAARRAALERGLGLARTLSTMAVVRNA